MGTRHIPVDDAGPRVRDVMMLEPTTMPPTATVADARRIFEEELARVPEVTYVRFNIFPDGGVARLRLYGRPA